MDPEKERLALHCAYWLQACSRTHALWCNCGLWTSHIKGWQPTADEDGNVAADAGDGTLVKVDGFGRLVDIDAAKTPDGYVGSCAASRPQLEGGNLTPKSNVESPGRLLELSPQHLTPPIDFFSPTPPNP